VTGRDDRVARGHLTATEAYDGVRFIWVRTTPYRGNDWRRPVNMLSYFVMLLVVQARRPAPDVVIGSTVHPFAALGAWIVAKLRHAVFIFEVRDLWPQTLVDLGAMRAGSPGERFLRGLESFLVRRATVVITLLPGMADYLHERGLPAGHVHYVPNGVDLAAFDRAASLPAEATTDPAAPDVRIRSMRDEGRLVIGYVGALGRVNHLETVIRAAALAESRAPGRVGVVLVGDGPERAELERIASGVRAVAIASPIPKAQVPRLLRSIDVGLVHATANPVYKYGISFNKLFEYLAAERPVIFACTSAYDPVATTGSGLSIPPDDPEGLAEAMLELAGTDSVTRARMGSAGRALVVRQHDLTQLADDLARLQGIARPDLA
jgi:glycosyltransferase involved in cell wall biosynthesis